MTELTAPDLIENAILVGTKNDVVPSVQQPTMATEDPSGPHTLNDYSMVLDSCGAGGVSALSLNDNAPVAATVTATATATSPNMNIANDTSTINEQCKDMAVKMGNVRGKRRRKKSKQKTNNKPYKKSNWKFMTRSRHISTGGMVPYNTNKFLMEEHMPDAGRLTPSGRHRDSSFSVDSDENIYNEEEFLSKEFSSVYEDARSERLENMTKQQLIQEYLQMEANFDKLNKTMGARKSDYDNAKEVQHVKHFETQDVIRKLEDKVKELTVENQELRRQMADIRNRDRNRSHSGSRQQHRHNHNNHRVYQNGHHHNRYHNSISSGSEDSESDSSSSDTGSDSNSSKSGRSRTSDTSKSSLSEMEDNMSGIDDTESQQLLVNGHQDDVPDVVAIVNGEHAKWPAMAECDENDKVHSPLLGVSTNNRNNNSDNNSVTNNTRE